LVWTPGKDKSKATIEMCGAAKKEKKTRLARKGGTIRSGVSVVF
jgi:hypothetical protein